MLSPMLTTGSSVHVVAVVIVIWRWERHCVAPADLDPLNLHDSLISASQVAGMSMFTTMPGIHSCYVL